MQVAGVLALLVSLALTAIVIASPRLRFAYRSPDTHVVIETAAVLIIALAAYLAAARFGRDRRVPGLLTALGLGILAVATTFFAPLSQATGVSGGWSAASALLAGSLCGGVLFALSSYARPSELPKRSRAAPLASVGVLAAFALIWLLLDHVGGDTGTARSLSPADAIRPRPSHDAVVIGAQVMTVAAYLVAWLGFLRRGARDDDEMIGWLSVACAFAAAAQLNYLLFPTVISQWVYTGDVLRLAFCATVLIGAIREIAAYQPQLAQAAVVLERRRMARDLHDGLSHELAFITGQADTLVEQGAGDEVRNIAAAAKRATEESRQAIAALTRPADEPVDISLATTASELAGRGGAALALELQRGVSVDVPTRETMLRVMREALANAIRHGHARRIAVTLEADDDLRLRIADDGAGFDVDRPGAESDGDGGSQTGLGLVSMRERAEMIGASLLLDSRPGQGTTVELVIPR
jgi:signal transduction histidine kinase